MGVIILMLTKVTHNVYNRNVTSIVNLCLSRKCINKMCLMFIRCIEVKVQINLYRLFNFLNIYIPRQLVKRSIPLKNFSSSRSYIYGKDIFSFKKSLIKIEVKPKINIKLYRFYIKGGKKQILI